MPKSGAGASRGGLLAAQSCQQAGGEVGQGLLHLEDAVAVASVGATVINPNMLSRLMQSHKKKLERRLAAANSEGADNNAEKKARKNTSRHCGRQNRPHSHSGYHKMKARVWKAEELAKEAAADAAAQATRAEAQAIRAKELERQLSEERRRMHLLQDTIEWAQTVRRFGGPDVDLRRRTRDLATYPMELDPGAWLNSHRCLPQQLRLLPALAQLCLAVEASQVSDWHSLLRQ